MRVKTGKRKAINRTRTKRMMTTGTRKRKTLVTATSWKD